MRGKRREQKNKREGKMMKGAKVKQKTGMRGGKKKGVKKCRKQ